MARFETPFSWDYCICVILFFLLLSLLINTVPDDNITSIVNVFMLKHRKKKFLTPEKLRGIFKVIDLHYLLSRYFHKHIFLFFMSLFFLFIFCRFDSLGTAWKVSVFGNFLVHIFPHSDWIRVRKTPTTDAFHDVILWPVTYVCIFNQ